MAAPEGPPCILVVDGDPGVVTGLTRELEHRYGRDYDFLATLSARSGFDMLERLRAASQSVALVIAGLRLPDMAGPEFLSLTRAFYPLAKRVALVGALEFRSSEALHRAVILGQADGWLLTQWAPRDPSLYAQVGDLLDEWCEDSGQWQFVGVHVVGEWHAPTSHEIRDLLGRHAIPHRFTTADSVEGREVLRQAGCGADRLPVFVLFNGQVLIQPTKTQVAATLGAPLEPDARPYDVAVVGAGPAGLSTAVSAASEGLRTVLIEREAFGG